MFFIQERDIKIRDEQGKLLGKLGDGSFGIVCRGEWVSRLVFFFLWTGDFFLLNNGKIPCSFSFSLIWILLKWIPVPVLKIINFQKLKNRN